MEITVPSGAASDTAGKQRATSASTCFPLDTTSPAVTISGPSVTITNGGSVSYAVTFSDADLDREGVVEGKRVALGGRRIIKKKNVVTPGTGTATSTN